MDRYLAPLVAVAAAFVSASASASAADPAQPAAPAAPAAPPAAGRVEIIAHRGASHDAPENTVAAWKLGFEQGADAGELDVWISKDGRAVVMHDASPQRTAGTGTGTGTGAAAAAAGKIADLTLAELKGLDVGSYGKFKGGKFAGERVPTLEEALATVPAGRRMFVEIKCGPEGVPETLRAVKEAGLSPAQTPLISFNAAVLTEAKKLRPDLAVYWLVGLGNKKGKEIDVDAVIAKAKAAGFEGLDVSDNPILDAGFVRKTRAAGLKLYVWTVDDPAAAKRLAALGVDGITTNRPGLLRAELGLPALPAPAPTTPKKTDGSVKP
jgi:glycerophosphoryl diester phosphodiesterase